MADSLSVVVDSPPKLDLSSEQGHREAKSWQAQRTTTHEAELSPSNFQKAVAEFVGTYILVFAGCGAALVNQVQPLTVVGIAMVAGLALTVAIYSLGHVSGGHFNPAVTIALAAVRRIQFKLVPTYVLCQLLGATLASLTLKVLYDDKVDIRVALTQYSSSTTDLEAVIWEYIITSTLMLTICGAATDHRGSRDLAGVAIGISVLLNVIIAGPITGASMNPARSLGPAIVSGVYKNIWVYMTGPTMGAASASMLYMFLRPREPKPDKSHETEDRT